MLGKGSTRGKPKKVVEEEEDAKNKVMSAAAAWAGTRVQELDLPKSALAKSGGARGRQGSTSNSDLAKTIMSKENGARVAAGVGSVSQPQSTQVSGYAVYRQLDPQLLTTLAVMLTDIVQSESLAHCHAQIVSLLDDLIRLTADQALQTLGQMDEIQEAITVHQINLKRKRSQSASSSASVTASSSPMVVPPTSNNDHTTTNSPHDPGDESEDVSLAESKDPKLTSREHLSVPGSSRSASSSRSRTASRKKHHKKKPEKRSPKEIELVCSRIEQIADVATLANALSTLVRSHPELLNSVMSILKIDPSETIQEALLGLSSTRANYLRQYPQSEPESEGEAGATE